MDEVLVDTILVDGKEYFLLESLEDDKGVVYFYFSNIGNRYDVKVFKDLREGGEEYYIPLDDEIEFDRAMELFYNKYGVGN